MMWNSIAMVVESPLPMGEAVQECRRQLATKGFGVVTEIDMQATLQDKLGVEVEPMVILGACHPQTAHELLEADPSLGVLLPCNVTVSSEDGATMIRTVDTREFLGLIEDPESREAVEWIRNALRTVLEELAKQPIST